MKTRLLFAAVDIGYRIENYSKFLREKFPGIFIQSFVKYKVPDSHYKAEYDFLIDYYQTNRVVRSFAYFAFFLYALFRYNTFYFLSGETILSRRLRRFELSVYKFFGKRLIFNFVGSDIRSEEYLKWKSKNIVGFLSGEPTPEKSEDFQKLLIDDAVAYADSLLVSTPDLLELVPSAKYYPVIYDVESLSAEMDRSEKLAADENKIYILHAPSNVALKGTDIITGVLEKLKNEFPGEIEIILPHKNKTSSLPYSVSRYELFQLMNQADIVIDQLIIGWYGLQSIEALIAGKVVLCYVERDLEKYLFDGCPIVNVNALDLEDKLKESVENIKKNLVPEKKDLIEWLKKNHTLESNNADLVEAIFGEKS